MIFHTARKKITPPKISIQGNEVEFVTEFNFLGIIIDNQLTWKPHLNYINKKIAKTIGIMNRLKRFLPQTILLTLYHSLIMPYLNYGNLVWSSQQLSLAKLQKKAIQIVSNSKYNAHTEPLLKSLGTLKITDLCALHELKFCYKLENQQLPIYLSTIFNKHHSNHQYRTRHSNNFQIPRMKHEYAKKCIRYKIPVTFNNCPETVREKIQTHSYQGFTTYVKKHFLNQYSYECHLSNCYICSAVS